MREKNIVKRGKTLPALIIILIILQALTVILMYYSQQDTIIKLNQTKNYLDDRVNSLSLDTLAKVNSLTDSINTLSSSQSDIKSQISQIKATTSSDFSGIIEENLKGVVTIKTNAAQGTGFIISDDGYIVTNAHVLSSAKYANIYTYDGNKYAADLIGYDVNLDVALLKISGSFNKLELGNSDEVKLGEKVIAIGNPLGLSFSTSEGIISARDRDGSNNLPYYFQTDASLNPGNSGGPLINTQGQVIGINNFKITSGESLGFALEINYAKEAVNEISLKAMNETIV